MPSLNEIRSTYLSYFGANDHAILPSAPLVPQSDPTLLFVNAGMVPFKNIFIGAETPPAPRATTSQRCVRAGGKHNDLDNVGYTARHLTFFEMLGNFSFGDYFKERAIDLAWTLLTRDFGLPKDKLLVTVYSPDDEAAALWKKIAGLSDDRIIRIPTKSSSTTARRFPAGLLAPPTRTATGSSRSGTWSSCSSTSRRTEPASRCPSLPSTPAWGWSGSRRCCKASTTSSRSTSSSP
jgi:hypothetical protein